MKDFKNLEFIGREVDFAIEAYCIECGKGGHVKNTANRLYFYEGFGPFDKIECFSDYVGIEKEKLPPIKKLGRLK